MSSSVKQQLIKDLQMSGLAASTQKLYLEIIVRFVKQTRTRPQDATEAQVADYLRGLIRDGRCQGTIAPARSALRFVFEDTLGRQWRLFKKRSPVPAASVCPRLPPTPRVAASSLPSASLPAGSAWL